MQKENKKRCLIIMSALYIGGAEKQYRYIISALSKIGRELTVLLLNKPLIGQEKQSQLFINEHASVKFYQLNGDVLNCKSTKKIVRIKEKLKAYFAQRRWLKKYLRETDVDIVMFSYVTQLLMTRIFHKHKVKVVFNERNTGRQICDKKFKIKLLHQCDRVIANSSFAADYINQKTGINVSVFNNGIQFSEIQQADHSGYNILIPARVTRIKNQLIALKALTLLKNPKAKIIFAGVIDDVEYSYELKKYVSENNLSDKVEFLGFVDNMKELYQKADLILLTSFEEGTPNVLLEAYMYRILPIVSNIPMNASCCLYDELLFNPNDEYELATKIELAGNDMLVKDIKSVLATNYKFLQDNYNLDNMARKYDDLLFGEVE